MLAPCFNHDLGLLQCVEDLAVEKFVTKLRVEALAVSVLPRTPGHNVSSLRSDSRKPIAKRLCDELWAIIGSNMCRDTSQDEEIGESVDDVGGFELPVDPDRQALPCELVDDVQHAVFSSIMRPVFNEVI